MMFKWDTKESTWGKINNEEVNMLKIGDKICITDLPEYDINGNDYYVIGGGGTIRKIEYIVEMFDGPILRVDGGEYDVEAKSESEALDIVNENLLDLDMNVYTEEEWEKEKDKERIVRISLKPKQGLVDYPDVWIRANKNNVPEYILAAMRMRPDKIEITSDCFGLFTVGKNKMK